MKDKIKETVILAIILALVFVMAWIVKSGEKKHEAEMIVGVHVKGEVNIPGYYELKYGSRVKDAIDYAGGKTAKADTDSVNLAMELFDGQELIIKAKNEAEPKKSEPESAGGKVNLNEADMIALCQLEGIGEEIAGAIIEYRAKKGSFKSIEELKKVKGIGQSKFNAIKDKITV